MKTAPLALALAAVAVAGVQAAPSFSHRLHVKLMGCRQCHTAAASSTSAADNLLPAPELCAKCHSEPYAPTPTRGLVAHFSHAGHLRIADLAGTVSRAIAAGQYLAPAAAIRQELDVRNACTACHRGLAEPDTPARSPLARMADCLVCHKRIEPPDSCRQCHAAGVALKPASHTPDFPDTHTSGKLNLDKTTCAVCHGRRFICQGCH